jgi:two-component system nitrogen regulation sensor histidine kinase NtrY
MTVQPTTLIHPILRQIGEWSSRVGLSRKFAVALTVAAILSGVATYVAITGSPPLGPDPDTVLILLNVDLVLLLILGALVARSLVKLWSERRRGSAGSRLHVRLVVMFSLVAVTPTIVVAVFSALFFNFGIQAWFSERVRTALHESLAVTDRYLQEHQQAIRADILAMAGNLSRDAPLLMQSSLIFQRAVEEQAASRALPEVIVFDGTGRIIASSALSLGLQIDWVPESALEQARKGEVAIMAKPSDERVRALVRLDRFFDTYLYVGRFISSEVLSYVTRAKQAVEEYERLEGKRSGLEISFFMLFALVALMLLMAAIWTGLMFATRLAGPISGLIAAAERVRGGDLSARVAEDGGDDEIGMLSRAFNRMTSRLERQRRELVEANRQLDARRQFTETVLAGVSAGVIGLDANGRINLPNRSASELLSVDLEDMIDRDLSEAVPEMSDLIDKVRRWPERFEQAEINIIRGGRARTLLVRIAAERIKREVIGYVVTFDDITELQTAQRKAAWSDVARRVAHEIKNPLTPIQLSAERLKRKYLSQITTDREIFEICTDTIVRQVDDIGRMVDEFSEFARMPAPVLREEELSEICQQPLFLQRSAHPDIEFKIVAPDGPIQVRCDRHQLGQAITNLLQNAADSILDQGSKSKPRSATGKVVLTLARSEDRTEIIVEDNGPGFPPDIQHRLLEPYVTSREKGTGLGLAIVRKIMEDHMGDIVLENRDGGGARVKLIFGASETDLSPKDEAATAETVETASHGS